VTKLEEAAVAYAKADKVYRDAYDAWRETATPEELRADSHIELPSWKQRVHASCVASSDAMRLLCARAEAFAKTQEGGGS
jgi:hypothetical protein